MSGLVNRATSLSIPGLDGAQTKFEEVGLLKYLQDLRDKGPPAALAILKKAAAFVAWSTKGVQPEDLINYLRYLALILMSCH